MIHVASTPRLSRFGLSRPAWVRVAVAVAAAATLFCLADRSGPRASKTPAARVWVGELAAAPVSGTAEAVPLRSSSLVVPSAELALPAVAKAPIQVKNACDSADARCALRPLPLNVPVRRQVTADNQARPAAPKRTFDVKTVSLTSQLPEKKFSLNPLDHLPDAAVIGRPFEAARSVVSGWVRRL